MVRLCVPKQIRTERLDLFLSKPINRLAQSGESQRVSRPAT